MFSRLNQKRNILQKGFTLVEMMVSLTLFTVVMTASTGVMLVVLDANRKAQSFQTAMDNLGVALESISRDMRVGTNYYCFTGPGLPSFATNQDCSSGDTYFAFLPIGAVNNPTNYWVYRLNSSSGKGVLERCKQGQSCNSSSKFFALTAPEIDIRYFKVFVTNSAPRSVGDLFQSKARIVIEGVAGAQVKIQTEFSVQTTISQFQLDI